MSRMGRRRKYDWNLWFSHPQTIIRRGVDYQISQFMMVQSIKNMASKMGVVAKVTDMGDYILIEPLINGNEYGVSHTNKTPVSGKPKSTLEEVV